jgi:predicted methyltransferase
MVTPAQASAARRAGPNRPSKKPLFWEAAVAQFKTLLAVSAAAASLAFAAQAQAPNIHDPKPSAAVSAAVADPARPAADTARDENRKPALVVAVSGLKPGQVVAELASGGGYYTRILAKTVGAKGKVISVVGMQPNADAGMKALQPTYPNLSIVADDLTKLTALPEKVDMVWTTDNYHDFHNRLDMAAFDKAVFDALKPGGIFFVEDHAAAPGAGATVTKTLHRIEPSVVQQEVTAAGFKLVRTSDILANPDDAHTTQNAETSIRGHTDRFIMVFQKP